MKTYFPFTLENDFGTPVIGNNGFSIPVTPPTPPVARLQYVGSATVSYGNTVYGIAVDATNVYAVGITTNKIFKYDKNLTYVGSSIALGDRCNALLESGNFLYVGTDEALSKVLKFNKSDLTLAGSTNAFGGEAGNAGVLCMSWSPDKNTVFLGTNWKGKDVLGIATSNLATTYSNTSTYSAGGIMSINVGSGTVPTVYIGEDGADNIFSHSGNSALTQLGSASVVLGSDIFGIVSDDSNVFIGGYTTKVFKYDRNLTYVGSNTLALAPMYSMATYDNLLYCGIFSGTSAGLGNVWILDKNLNFVASGNRNLGADRYITSMVVDSTGVYIAANTTVCKYTL